MRGTLINIGKVHVGSIRSFGLGGFVSKSASNPFWQILRNLWKDWNGFADNEAQWSCSHYALSQFGVHASAELAQKFRGDSRSWLVGVFVEFFHASLSDATAG